MKTLLAFLILALPVFGQLPFALETEIELSSSGDFNGDGLRDFVIVDRETGSFRVLTQAADGSFATGESRPTGVAHPTAIGVGKILRPGPDTLAVTAPDWNGVNLLLNNDPPYAAPQTGLGPSALAVLDVPAPGFPPAYDDMMVASNSNTPPDANGLALIRVDHIQLSPEPLTVVDTLLSHGRRVFLKSGVGPFGGFIAGNTEFRAIGGDLSTVATAAGLATDSDYQFGFFGGSNLADFLFYTPGATTIEARQVAEPTPEIFEFSSGTTYDLGAPIHLVGTVQFPGGTWLLVIFGAGETAVLYDFDGANPPAPRQTFTAPPGEGFTSAASLAGGHLLLTAGIGGHTTGWQRHDFDGSTHVPAGSGTWAAPNALSSSATVFVFTAEPFVDPDAKIVSMLKAGDWTTSVSSAGYTRTADALRFLDAAGGLGSPFSKSVEPFGTSEFAVPNQFQPDISFATFSAIAGDPRPPVRFSPVPGEYDVTLLDPIADFQVKLATDAPSATIFYRLSQGTPWLPYTDTIHLAGNATIQAYAGDTAQGTASPIASAAYSFTAQSPLAPTLPVDFNGNGLGDAWEKAFGVTDPNGDPDGDGFTSSQEYLAGTDPRDASSFPSGGTGNGCDPVLFIRIEDGSGTREAVVSWPSSLSAAILQSSPDLKIWSPVTSGIALKADFFEWRTLANGKEFFRLATNPGACELALYITIESDGSDRTTAVVRWADSLQDAKLQTSIDLLNWSPVSTGILHPAGFFEWREPATGRRFFRLAR